jgi:hypothetical protein
MQPTKQAEASIPTEIVRGTKTANQYRTFISAPKPKSAQNVDKLTRTVAAISRGGVTSPQAEAILARKKPRLDGPLLSTTTEADKILLHPRQRGVSRR